MQKTQTKKKDAKEVKVKEVKETKKEPVKEQRKVAVKPSPPKEKRPVIPAIKKFLKGSWGELKKVQWPNRPQLITFTGVVIVAVLIVGFGIFIIDSILSKLLTLIIK